MTDNMQGQGTANDAGVEVNLDLREPTHDELAWANLVVQKSEEKVRKQRGHLLRAEAALVTALAFRDLVVNGEDA